MLKSIDVLIGVAVVMLVVSAAVTALTQFVLHIRQAKGENLKKGVADLLQLIAPNFTRTCAEEISAAVLKHPLVRRADGKLSETIHREELVKILLDLATATGDYKLADTNRDALKKALADDKIPDPAQVLENARSLLLQLEMAHPELSNAMRADIALLQEAASPFLAKVHSWFDQTIDRTVDRFTIGARKVTFCCAAAVALFLQLDTIGLINQLSVDPQLRSALVQEAIKINAAGPPAASSSAPASDPVQQLRADLAANQKQMRDLSSLGLFRIPDSLGGWAAEFKSGNFIMKIAGLLISSILLSLGAPFWYNALKTLIGLRSAIANKDDAQRKERQTLTAPAGGPAVAVAAAGAGAASSAPAAVLRGERGFLG
jgi:hypothetical protein